MKLKKNYSPVSRCHKKSIRKYNKCIKVNKCKKEKCEEQCWKLGITKYMKCEKHLTKIEKLFDAVKQASIQYRKAGLKDGQAFWKPIKEHLPQTPIPKSNWKYIGKHIRDKVQAIPEYTKTKTPKIIEKHHFLIQQIRIPTTAPLCARKVIQLALNIGQFKGSNTRKFSEDINYNSFNLTEISRYVYNRDLQTLSDTISDTNYEYIMKYISKYIV